MILSKYCKIFPHRKITDSFILFSTKRASSVFVSKSVLDDIERGNLSLEEKETLSKLGFLVQDSNTEKQEMLNFIDDLNAINKKFKVIVILNLDCNLACKYCFEGKRKGNFYMTRETADQFIDFMKKKIGFFREIKITFYGGEPLLSTELIIYISERLKSPAEANGIKYSFSLITNGTLLSADIVKKLKPFGLTSADITLDGPENIHNSFRPFKSGRGTFDTIVRNIKDFCDMINIHIGGNYTKDNYSEFPSLLDYLMDNGLTPDRISSLIFYPVIKESPEFALPDFTGGCVSINEPWLFDAGIFLRGEILKRGYKTQKIMPSACMMELKNSLVINYDGGFYKCPGLIGREEFRVGDIKTGIKDYRQSHNLDNYKNDECLNCSYLPLCFGGCRYMKLVRDGTLEGVDCKKPYLDAALRDLVFQDIEPTRP